MYKVFFFVKIAMNVKKYSYRFNKILRCYNSTLNMEINIFIFLNFFQLWESLFQLLIQGNLWYNQHVGQFLDGENLYSYTTNFYCAKVQRKEEAMTKQEVLVIVKNVLVVIGHLLLAIACILQGLCKRSKDLSLLFYYNRFFTIFNPTSIFFITKLQQ